MVFLDAYDGDGNVPQHLMAPGFLEACADVLAPGGVVVANLFNGTLAGGGFHFRLSFLVERPFLLFSNSKARWR